MDNQQTHRSLTGIVTRLVGDGATYGCINDEIFFPQAVVAGGPASVGDEVFAECEYSAHLPIKWNATSVRILNKGGLGHNQTNNLNPDPRLQQDPLNQQQQSQQFNQSSAVAVTYQQHRQQRQQRQMLDVSKQQDDNKSLQQSHHHINEQQPRLLDQHAGEFYPPGVNTRVLSPQQQALPMNQQQVMQHQPQDANMLPFQDQPMGPPNFTFTSQPGSAFVQNQFVPPAFLPQQAPPPPLLPQSTQQHLIPNNQTANQNQRKGGPGSNRFNNAEKNDRQQNRRNQNRNENKFDRPRSGERDGPNNRSRRDDNRDAPAGRNNKRDEIARPSPPSHSSARSTTSSDRVIKSSRRHYEPQNIPKTRIMTNMNAYNMKQRCPSSVHVPSDLKDIIVNEYFRLDIKSTPKPLKYNIKSPQPKDLATTSCSDDKKVEESKDDETKETDISTGDNDPTGDKSSNNVVESKTEQPNPPSSRSDIRLNHKYGVKVILLSIPEFDTVYRKIFGQNLDSYSSESKSRSKLDESISLLCNKSSNNGHSLIGGKFDPVLDGFVEGAHNKFERHGRQPDLIATCKRVVMEQTGLDLSPCRGWNHLSTFIYNNKSDYFSPRASVEYSYIYMPQIWTMLKEMSDNHVNVPVDFNPSSDDNQTSSEQQESQTPKMISDEQRAEDDKPKEDQDKLESENLLPPSQSTESGILEPDALAEMKRNDLKLELEQRGIKFKSTAKKSELLELLRNPPKEEQICEDETENVEDDKSGEAETQQEPQLEEGEVVENDQSEDSTSEEFEDESKKESVIKRHANDFDGPEMKKMRIDGDVKDQGKKVELITEVFEVESKGEQQLSLVSLNEASQGSRHDQFELSVATNILKESLIQHLSEYIFTTLVEDHKQKSSQSSPANPQESIGICSDSNNNNGTSKTSAKSSIQNVSRVNLKECPVDRYINLAFSYFDSTHMGYVYFDDLNKLFNNSGLTISKRALISLLGDDDKFNYRTLQDLSPKLPPTYSYVYPEQFRQLPDSSSESTSLKTIEYKGVVYDVEKLIQEVKDAETLRVSMVDRFNYAIENSDKQAEEIHVLEVSQKSLSKAIKTQNDEICDLKRERDSIKRKYEVIRKGIKGSISSLSELINDDK